MKKLNLLRSRVRDSLLEVTGVCKPLTHEVKKEIESYFNQFQMAEKITEKIPGFIYLFDCWWGLRCKFKRLVRKILRKG